MSKETPKNFNRTDHLANERTFLAWIRTNLGIMAFGFVVAKFSFFVKQIAFSLGKSEVSVSKTTHETLQGYSSLFGTVLIAIGTLFCVFAFLKFKKTEKQINEDTYQPSRLLEGLLTALIFFGGISLVIYLYTQIVSK